MTEQPDEDFNALAVEADDLLDQVENALEEHAGFHLMLKTRMKVDELSKRYAERVATLDEKGRAQVHRTVGRKLVDLEKMATRLPAPPVGKPAEKRVDTGFFETRAGTSSRPPVTIGGGTRRDPKALRVTAEIDAWCGRCAQVRTQVIAAMVGDEPAQVVCQICGGRSRYRAGPPPRLAKEEAPRATRAPTPVDREAEARAKTERDFLDSLRAAEKVRTYAPRERFKAGEIIEHPEHGRGKIENVLPRSLLVRFSVGLKTLKLG